MSLVRKSTKHNKNDKHREFFRTVNFGKLDEDPNKMCSAENYRGVVEIPG